MIRETHSDGIDTANRNGHHAIPQRELEVLCEACRNGDGEALMQQFTPLMMGKLRHRGVDVHTAEDLCQETWNKILHIRETLRPHSFPQFLFLILERRLVDHWRKHQHDRSVIPSGDDQKLDEYPSREMDPVRTALVQERTKVLLACIAALKQQDRTLYEMYYRDGKNTRDIAAVLGSSKGAVSQRLFYLRKRLRAKMEQAGFTTEDIG